MPSPTTPALLLPHEDKARSASPMALAAPLNPVGLLYTLLRHGRGLSHEEANRRSLESIGGHGVKAA